MAGTTAAAVAAYAAVASAVAATAGAVVQGVSSYQQGKVQEAQNRYNAQQEEYAREQAFQEESLNSTQHYRRVRHEIAAGQNLMSGSGNLGTSAESATRGALFNLSEDLSALDYRYGAEATQHRNAAVNYTYNASVAKKNRKVGVLASSLNTVSTAGRGVTRLYEGGYIS